MTGGFFRERRKSRRKAFLFSGNGVVYAEFPKGGAALRVFVYGENMQPHFPRGDGVEQVGMLVTDTRAGESNFPFTAVPVFQVVRCFGF